MKQIADAIYGLAERNGVQLPPRGVPEGESVAAAAHPGRAMSEAPTAERAFMIVEAPNGIADLVLGTDGASDSVVLHRGLARAARSRYRAPKRQVSRMFYNGNDAACM